MEYLLTAGVLLFGYQLTKVSLSSLPDTDIPRIRVTDDADGGGFGCLLAVPRVRLCDWVGAHWAPPSFINCFACCGVSSISGLIGCDTIDSLLSPSHCPAGSAASPTNKSPTASSPPAKPSPTISRAA
jgi:hypothetical protein